MKEIIMPNQNKQDWKDKLLDFLDDKRNRYDCPSCNGTVDLYKLGQFIEQTLHQEREKAVEKVKKLAGEYMNINDFNNFEDDLALLHPTNKTNLEKILEQHPDITSDEVYKNGLVVDKTKV